MEMSEKIEDIVDKVIDGAEELNDYLDGQIKDILKNIISTTFEVHSYANDPIRVFFMIDIIVNNFVINLLGKYQDAVVESLSKGGIIADFSIFSEQRERMK